MNDFWIPFSIVVATALFNALFYILIKSDSDKKLESYKAAYSGVFEKKLNIYIELLESLDKLKEMTIDYGHAGNKSIYTPEEIRTEFNRFIRKKIMALFFIVMI